MHVRIGVIGGGQAAQATLDWACQVGACIAGATAVLICGGRGGVMEAACRGCAEAGGMTVGILPGDDACAANPHVKLPIVTDMGHARNVIIAQTAEALIAIDGEYGTLSEVAIALKLGKPVFGRGRWASLPAVVPVQTPQEAVSAAIDAVQRNREKTR